MLKNNSPVVVVTIFLILLNFEFRAVREFERTHYGWYCYLSFDFNRKSKQKESMFYREFQNIFISSEQIDEIRDQITDILEREDENDASDSYVDPDNTDFFTDD